MTGSDLWQRDTASCGRQRPRLSDGVSVSASAAPGSSSCEPIGSRAPCPRNLRAGTNRSGSTSATAAARTSGLGSAATAGTRAHGENHDRLGSSAHGGLGDARMPADGCSTPQRIGPSAPTSKGPGMDLAASLVRCLRCSTRDASAKPHMASTISEAWASATQPRLAAAIVRWDDFAAIEREAEAGAARELADTITAANLWPAEAAAAPGLDVPPETESVRRCVTHHACDCHMRLAEIGRRYLAARPAGRRGRSEELQRKHGEPRAEFATSCCS